ncbi:MAG: hypothetical protein ABSB82_07165 [Terriglobia bacterium]|jgi:hypothetical protein
MSEVDDIKLLLNRCSKKERREIFDLLRVEFPIHALEAKLNIPAEAILEAIDRASDLTLRGVRGVIAEVAFKLNVADKLEGWDSEELRGDFPYDFLLRDQLGAIRVQVKMQRLKSGVPMMASQGYKRLPADMYVVETQRTRGGKDPKTGEDTRPYKFGEFDVLAVSMHPSTREWSSFMYTVAKWLLPRPENKALMLKFQPVARTPNDVWTDSLETCIRWLRSKQKKTILL